METIDKIFNWMNQDGARFGVGMWIIGVAFGLFLSLIIKWVNP